MRFLKLRNAMMILVVLAASSFFAVDSPAEGPGGSACDWVTCYQWCWELYEECRSENAEAPDGCYMGMLFDCSDMDYCCESPGPDGF